MEENHSNDTPELGFVKVPLTWKAFYISSLL